MGVLREQPESRRLQAQPLAGALRHRDRALPGQEMTTGDVGVKKTPTCYENNKKRDAVLFAAQVQHELLTAGRHGCQQLMDGYGGLLNPGSTLPGSVPRSEAVPALPCTQHLPPPKDGPRAQPPLGLTQNHSALQAISCQQRFSHTRIHIPARPGANQLFSHRPFRCRCGETEALEG